MSDRMTAIDLPGTWGSGVAEYGRQSVPAMIAIIRLRAERQKADAEAILAAADGDFRVRTYVGVLAMNKMEVLQRGRAK